MEKIPFGYSIHPGEILKTEFMEPLGLSAYRLAKELHLSAVEVEKPKNIPQRLKPMCFLSHLRHD